MNKCVSFLCFCFTPDIRLPSPILFASAFALASYNLNIILSRSIFSPLLVWIINGHVGNVICHVTVLLCCEHAIRHKTTVTTLLGGQHTRHYTPPIGHHCCSLQSVLARILSEEGVICIYMHMPAYIQTYLDAECGIPVLPENKKTFLMPSRCALR